MAISNGNGAEVKTPGGWFVRFGGPSALVVAVVLAMMYIQHMERVGIYDKVSTAQRMHHREVIEELRLVRCAQVFPIADRQVLGSYLSTDAKWRKYCAWLFHENAQDPVDGR